MKKILFLFASLFLTASTMTTLTSCGDDDDAVSPVIPELPDDKGGDDSGSDDGELLHEFSGWLNVSAGTYIQNAYYGEGAVMRVYKKDDAYICLFHDNTWGDGRFDITMERGQVSGTGTLTMPNHRNGTVNNYEATIAGPMTKMTISVPSVMGGTNITWNYGTRVGGTFTGTNNFTISAPGVSYEYSADNVAQTVTVNSDGSVNLTISEYGITGTMMGDLTLGSYTIQNIPFNQQKNGFYKEYADGTLSFHFKAVKDGQTMFDDDYVFNNSATTTSILIKPTETGISIVNDFSIGSMPFPISAVMEGTKQQ